jgi:hypothetical protein
MRMTRPVSPFALPLLAFSLVAAQTHSTPPVSVELRVPEAETHVIGDAIPLFWRFQNHSASPLAFMWEGCCRFNGRLTVTYNGAVIPPTPPGQALAHMFAKAERLDPGAPRDFDTRLADWVALTNSGTYELRGHYQGVLPFQRPQVARGLELWRDTAATTPLRVSVLNVADYLAQAAARAARRGLRLELTGPDRLPPLQPIALRLEVSNTGSAPQTVAWPDAFQLWLVNRAGQRVPGAAEQIEVASEQLTLAPGVTVEREFTVHSGLVEGAPFGDYRAFVDLAAGDAGQPRVPSNPLPFDWQLNQADVTALLTEAASGSRTGMRNAPLKLLRVYLAELHPQLALIEPGQLPAPAGALASELTLAACLKPHGPKPGRVEFDIRVPAAEAWFLDEAVVKQCDGKMPEAPRQQLATILALRRHLGWEVGVRLQPENNATIAHLTAVAVELAPLRAELADDPRVVLPLGGDKTSILELPVEPPPSRLLVRVQNAATGVRLEYLWRRGANAGSDAALPTFTRLDGAAAWENLLSDPALPASPIQIAADGTLTWEQLLNALRPLTQRGLTMTLRAEG